VTNVVVAEGLVREIDIVFDPAKLRNIVLG
jgi:hypothetical protein